MLELESDFSIESHTTHEKMSFGVLARLTRLNKPYDYYVSRSKICETVGLCVHNAQRHTTHNNNTQHTYT